MSAGEQGSLGADAFGAAEEEQRLPVGRLWKSE